LHRPQDAVDAGFLRRVVTPAELLDLAITEARELGASAESFRREKPTHEAVLEIASPQLARISSRRS
jgi:hypothetical protein